MTTDRHVKETNLRNYFSTTVPYLTGVFNAEHDEVFTGGLVFNVRHRKRHPVVNGREMELLDYTCRSMRRLVREEEIGVWCWITRCEELISSALNRSCIHVIKNPPTNLHLIQVLRELRGMFIFSVEDES